VHSSGAQQVDVSYRLGVAPVRSPNFGAIRVSPNFSRRVRNAQESPRAYYLEEIRHVQPHVPYLLGGYSFGGLVSYEIALELRAVRRKSRFVSTL
jgi:thioesterase domain-containing protein